MPHLGMDLGASGLRALLTDDEGAPIGAAERPCAAPYGDSRRPTGKRRPRQ